MQYRPLPAAHRDAFHDLASYAFAPDTGPDFDDRDEDRPVLLVERAVYDLDAAADVADAALDTDDIRAICGYYEFSARLRGDWNRLGGVSAVASPPEHRRQGHVAFMLDELLAEFREEGVAFSALWPFEYAFYRHFGWAIVGWGQSVSVAPADLAGAVADPAGSFVGLDEDDWAALDRVHRAWAHEAFAVDRSEDWWRHRVLDSPWRDVYAAGWTDAAGTLQGYCIYRIEKDDGERTLTVSELAFTDEAARRQLLRYLRDHDSQVGTVRFHGRRVADLFETLTDPRAAEVTSRPGPMVRVVDVEAAVTVLAVPEAVSGSVVVGVDDDRCAWNDGVFELRFQDGVATCASVAGSTTGATAATAADVHLDVGSFSQLVTGCVPLDRLRHHDGVVVHDEDATTTLAAAYPADPGYLREGF